MPLLVAEGAKTAGAQEEELVGFLARERRAAGQGEPHARAFPAKSRVSADRATSR